MVVGQHGKKIRVGAIVQCRYDSTRLPGKALLNLPFGEESTVLSQIIDRLIHSKLFDDIVIATTDEEIDTPVANLAERAGVKVYRGSKENVLERFCAAAAHYNLDIIVRSTADNPLILTDLMQQAIEHLIATQSDYARIVKAPIGLGFEVISREALFTAAEKCDRNDDREHVTSYIKRHRDHFAFAELDLFGNTEIPDIRLTIDYPNDYALMNIVFNYLKTKQYNYTYQTLFSFLLKHPWLKDINPSYQKKIFNTLQEEKEEAINQLKFLGFTNIVEKLNEVDLEKNKNN